MIREGASMKVIGIFVLFMLACDHAAAQNVPVPRPRPFSAVAGVPAPPAKPETTANPQAEPSACRLRLTSELAVAPSLPSIEGPGECGATDLVRLEAIVLADATRVT